MVNVVILDSNFILLPFQFKIDYIDEIQFKIEGKTKYLIYRQVLDELEAKKKREPNATKFERHFKSGLSYIEKKRKIFEIETIEELKNDQETTDDFLVRKAVEMKDEYKHVFLATNDSELRKKAKKLIVSTIFLRKQSYIDIERS